MKYLQVIVEACVELKPENAEYSHLANSEV